MNQELIDLAIERGRLIERISSQRQLLGQQLQPVGDTLHATDRVVATVRNGCIYVRQNPHVVIAAVAVLVVLQPRRVWRWTRRGFFAWRTWRMLRREMAELGLVAPGRP
jgi:hypothetical protein